MRKKEISTELILIPLPFVRPFLRYRRRKRDEIMAQKAYQKFLSLKPPSLITTTTNNNDFDRIHNHTNFLLNNINNTCNLVNSSSNGNGGGGNINHVKNDYSSVDDALSTISSTNSDYNNMDNNNNNNNTNNQEDSYQNHNISENNGQVRHFRLYFKKHLIPCNSSDLGHGL